MSGSINSSNTSLEIIAFYLGSEQFCVETLAIREIRGWAPCTPLPHAPRDVLGVMNLRGSVIPIIDLAARLGMPAAQPTERSAIVVAEVHGKVVGLVVERVSDILSVSPDDIQPVPVVSAEFDASYAEGIIPLPSGMVCFLNEEPG
jgi:purine-binding chemotaxis protein CheW